MEDPLYREIILEHWENPQNYGEIKNPDVDATQSNTTCGDQMRIMGKIKNGKLVEISFISEGCAVSKASASMLTEKIKNMEIEKILKLKSKTVLSEFPSDLTPARFNCVLLCLKTIQKALV